MPTWPEVHQFPDTFPGTDEKRQASPDALIGEPALLILVRSVPSDITRHVALVVGLLPQNHGSCEVTQGITRAPHPGNPPAASRHSPDALFLIAVISVAPYEPSAKQSSPVQATQDVAGEGSLLSTANRPPSLVAPEHLTITIASPGLGVLPGGGPLPADRLKH
jgi:hypothetical protein